eukprot:TRINITY_DN24363_c0_g1_i1.p2 TRINITY_DN24363_c0_g1~~TRINITY_DN24363_c0_g1_i1.p2  ORF type:complete len:118 (+),score=12.85 TRINITY_DN24363_c0_g1_i1:272-625(+)
MLKRLKINLVSSPLRNHNAFNTKYNKSKDSASKLQSDKNSIDATSGFLVTSKIKIKNRSSLNPSPIRRKDSPLIQPKTIYMPKKVNTPKQQTAMKVSIGVSTEITDCLLYTSDAADE